jgi:hypothetical protein
MGHFIHPQCGIVLQWNFLGDRDIWGMGHCPYLGGCRHLGGLPSFVLYVQCSRLFDILFLPAGQPYAGATVQTRRLGTLDLPCSASIKCPSTSLQERVSVTAQLVVKWVWPNVLFWKQLCIVLHHSGHPAVSTVQRLSLSLGGSNLMASSFWEVVSFLESSF